MAKSQSKGPFAVASSQIASVAKLSSSKVHLPKFEFIQNSNLMDYPDNEEDVSDLTDLENSIAELGFTDPIEVTPVKGETDKYMILSGHRRRKAGVNKNMTKFPCIIREFNTQAEIRNYVLLANSHRDSSKNPLLICMRYKMHEAYLNEIDFKGSKREEIAKRLGISIPQADRYNRFNSIITPVWDLVKQDKVSMFSALNMYSLPTEDQTKIYEIFLYHLQDEDRLSREKCEAIIRDYVAKKERTEIEPEGTESQKKKMQKPQIYEGKRISRSLNRLNLSFDCDYEFDSPESAKKTMTSMMQIAVSIFDELENLKNKYENEDIRKELIKEYMHRLEDHLVDHPQA